MGGVIMDKFGTKKGDMCNRISSFGMPCCGEIVDRNQSCKDFINCPSCKWDETEPRNALPLMFVLYSIQGYKFAQSGEWGTDHEIMSLVTHATIFYDKPIVDGARLVRAIFPASSTKDGIARLKGLVDRFNEKAKKLNLNPPVRMCFDEGDEGLNNGDAWFERG